MFSAMSHFRILALVIGLSVFALPAMAREGDEAGVAVEKLTPQQQREESLDVLFARLQQSTSETIARDVEQKIWTLWSQSDSPTADVLLGQAVAAMDAQDSASSFAILDRVIASYPSYAEAWNKRATLNFMVGKYKASLSDIEKVLDLEPRHFGALAGRGMIYNAQEEWSLALDAYRDALAVNPNMPSVKSAIKELEKRLQDI
jgi:tetratricopeptide (TPR) repeat protein